MAYFTNLHPEKGVIKSYYDGRLVEKVGPTQQGHTTVLCMCEKYSVLLQGRDGGYQSQNGEVLRGSPREKRVQSSRTADKYRNAIRDSP